MLDFWRRCFFGRPGGKLEIRRPSRASISARNLYGKKIDLTHFLREKINPTPILHAIATLCFAGVVAGCSLDRTQYYYIRLEGHALQIQQYGRASPEALRAFYFFDHKDMPVSYSITREEYEISIVFPEDSYWTRLDFTANDSNGRSLYVGGELSDRCTRFTPDEDVGILGDEEPTELLGLYWSRGNGKMCDVEGIHVNRAFPLEIFVWDGDGNLLGTEKLNYRIMPNGIYWSWVGL
ncbi:MAG: hypothetical protein WB812_10535 [Woeseiaceae bacterium]